MRSGSQCCIRRDLVEPDLLRPRIKESKKTRYQRNVKIFIFTVVCLLIGMTLSHFQGGYVPVMSQWQNWPFSPVFDLCPPKAGIPVLHDVRVTMITPLVANNFGSVSPIKRHRKVKMNIFTFRWYLVFFNFLIRALGRPGSHFCTTSPTLTRPTVVSPTLTRPDLNLL